MEFIFHLWEGDQKTVKKFRHLVVFLMKMKLIFHMIFKDIKIIKIKYLKQKSQQISIHKRRPKMPFCDLVQTINENFISIFIENEIIKP